MHFVIHAFSNHVEVLNNVTPIDFDIRSVPSDHNIQISYKSYATCATATSGGSTW